MSRITQVKISRTPESVGSFSNDDGDGDGDGNEDVKKAIGLSGAPNDNFWENICSEDDLRSRIFGTFVVKFLACLPLLGFSNI